MLPKVAHGGLKFFWWYDKISYAPALSTVRPFCRQAKSDFCWPVRPLPFRWLGRLVYWFWYGVWGYEYVCGGSWEYFRKFFSQPFLFLFLFIMEPFFFLCVFFFFASQIFFKFFLFFFSFIFF